MYSFLLSALPEMVGHLHLQAMDDSLKGKNREGLLDSPDSGLPPSPSPPFYSLSPGLLESRSGSCTTPVEQHHGFYRKESKEGKLVSNNNKKSFQFCISLNQHIRNVTLFRVVLIAWPAKCKNVKVVRCSVLG